MYYIGFIIYLLVKDKTTGFTRNECGKYGVIMYNMAVQTSQGCAWWIWLLMRGRRMETHMDVTYKYFGCRLSSFCFWMRDDPLMDFFPLTYLFDEFGRSEYIQQGIGCKAITHILLYQTKIIKLPQKGIDK